MTPLGVGLALLPVDDFLQLCRPIIEQDSEFFEVMPETLWQRDRDGQLSWTSWADVFEQIRDRSGKPFTAHGLGLSIGAAVAGDDLRSKQWLEQIERDCRRFDYQWYTEHLGWCTALDQEFVLPLPLPATDESVEVVADRLGRIKQFLPIVGFENQVSYFTLGDVHTEAAFWNRICAAGDLWLLLDLHNAWTQCENYGTTLEQYMSELDLSRVLEIHLSGGGDSDPDWLPSRRIVRLDSHDDAIPEPVWQAFADVRPHCPNLRGVVIERRDDSITVENVAILHEELRRAKKIFWEG